MGERIPDDFELLHLPDHINICHTRRVNPQQRGGFPLLHLWFYRYLTLTEEMHNPETGCILWKTAFSNHTLTIKVWYFSNNPQLEVTPVYLQSSASSCPVHLCPSTFWVLCVQILIPPLQPSFPNITHSNNLSQSILIPFSTLQPFPGHPRPSSSSSYPAPWLLVQGTFPKFSVRVHSPLHSFSGPCKV